MDSEPIVLTITPIRYENVPPELQERFDFLWKQSDDLCEFPAGVRD